MEVYIKILIGVLGFIVLVVSVGYGVKSVVRRWMESVRETKRVEDGRKWSLSESERGKKMETVGILRRNGAGTPNASPRRNGEADRVVPKRVRFLEVEQDEDIVVQRQAEYGDAVLMVNDSWGEGMGDVF